MKSQSQNTLRTGDEAEKWTPDVQTSPYQTPTTHLQEEPPSRTRNPANPHSNLARMNPNSNSKSNSNNNNNRNRTHHTSPSSQPESPSSPPDSRPQRWKPNAPAHPQPSSDPAEEEEEESQRPPTAGRGQMAPQDGIWIVPATPDEWHREDTKMLEEVKAQMEDLNALLAEDDAEWEEHLAGIGQRTDRDVKEGW